LCPAEDGDRDEEGEPALPGEAEEYVVEEDGVGVRLAPDGLGACRLPDDSAADFFGGGVMM
jgi:hypothetical protein